MSRDIGGGKMTTIKSTININKYYKEQLELFVRTQELSSVTEGINLALEAFVKAKQKELYARQMSQAARDADFMDRTLSSNRDFEKIENGVGGEW